MVNSKAGKAMEVNIRKLTEDDRAQFEAAMQKELNSFLSSEAIQICSSAGIPLERILRVRWMHVWKKNHHDEGNETDRKAKSRLIIRGYEDPRLTSLPGKPLRYHVWEEICSCVNPFEEISSQHR